MVNEKCASAVPAGAWPVPGFADLRAPREGELFPSPRPVLSAEIQGNKPRQESAPLDSEAGDPADVCDKCLPATPWS